MIKVLILYYLSIKATHGYEIQKFIQINHMDSWTKIQSGSIYYALAKLEKEGLISLSHTVNIGAKVRKVYEITKEGRMQLKILVKEELKNPISEVGSDKFIVYPLLTVSDEAEITREVNNHIKELEKKKQNVEAWQNIKVNAHTLEVEKISFEMMISNIDYQIKWHEALLAQLAPCMEASKQITALIQSFDFLDI